MTHDMATTPVPGQSSNTRPTTAAVTPNPDKPEPKLTAKTKKESKKIEFGTQELTKVKIKNILIS
jgi:hypothetical protein